VLPTAYCAQSAYAAHVTALAIFRVTVAEPPRPSSRGGASTPRGITLRDVGALEPFTVEEAGRRFIWIVGTQKRPASRTRRL
jgi:hypothetical protein